MNKLRLWLSRNGFKVFLVGLLIVVFYMLIRNTNHYYENETEQNLVNQTEEEQTEQTEQTESTNQIEQNTTSNETRNETVETTSILQEIDSSSEEYLDVSNVTQKLLLTMFKAKTNNDDNARQELYNLFSDELLDEIFNENGVATSTGNSILNYISNIDDTQKYSIAKICKFSENNHVARYMIEQIYHVSEDRSIAIYMIINVDYNNHTFSYDGNVSEFGNVKDDKKIDVIENKGNNTF